MLAVTQLMPEADQGWDPQWEATQPQRMGYPDAERLIELAGRVCYRSWQNPSGRSPHAYVQHLVAQGHWSVLEHASVTLAFVGVSRAFTHELVRHRHLSFSQESQRYVEPEATRCIPPLLQWAARQGQSEWAINWVADQAQAHRAYAAVVRQLDTVPPPPGVSKGLWRKRIREAARSLLTNATPTTIVVTGNHRAWREVLLRRGAVAADLEMREAMYAAWECLLPICPAVYEDLVWAHDALGVPYLTALSHAPAPPQPPTAQVD